MSEPLTGTFDVRESGNGIYYVGRDGQTVLHVDRFLAINAERVGMDRPEADVLLALLRFCIQRLEADLAKQT